ncbi:NADP-dependent alcohol dehydrogenase [Lentinula raphanica]|uniref:NADP-dependent alcohol dehydrogenase n=1 Tax=Lentinula raphanica TaxID=153919 RepID=A0AA38P3L5_9AGAR|nr:NADP-dependent alcohol dehydrogenase [Lentinula raphanica]KAJ3835586.1 NADP-dependent alcohol dehydrogenase [Lentinula raphanica]KAJ3965153.1 NADP-dependent alcohol dehydrogenase [Lentinula raphanica]
MGLDCIQFCGSECGEIVQKTFEHPLDLAADEVAVRVTHSGLCGTDLHFLKTDMVLGHEAIGIVHSIGSDVSLVQVGDRVGWGYPNWTCGRCDWCLRGEDNYCPNWKIYGVSDLDQGSLSTMAVRKEQWLFKIPENMSSEDAAPLMCGGSTVWTPLVHHVRPYHRVGIVGIGGLGHLAIQFAAKMGVEVVVFSATVSKRDEALQLGAKEFYVTKDVDDYSTLGTTKQLDRLLICTSAKLNLGLFYPLLSPQAMIIPLTASDGELTVPYFQTIRNGFSITGSVIATRFMQKEALEFAARNGVHVIAEKFPMTLDGVKGAMARLKDGKMRYRAVLSWDY